VDHLSSKKPAKEEEPLISEGIIGFRVFRIVDENKDEEIKDPLLKSLAVDSYWQPGINKAICQSSGAEAPEKHCHCGFNAYYKLGDRFLVMADFFRHYALAAIIGGGRVMLHRDGFRAERAAILGLVYNPITAGPEEALMQNQIAKKYRVPLYSNREQLIDLSQDSGLIIDSVDDMVDLDYDDYSFYQPSNNNEITLRNEIESLSHFFSLINFYYEFLNQDKQQSYRSKEETLVKEKALEVIEKDLGSKSRALKFLAKSNRGPIALAASISFITMSLLISLFDGGQGFLNQIFLFFAFLALPFLFIFIMEKSEALLRNKIMRSLEDKIYI
jgi:hypothetical protein